MDDKVKPSPLIFSEHFQGKFNFHGSFCSGLPVSAEKGRNSYFLPAAGKAGGTFCPGGFFPKLTFDIDIKFGDV